MCHVANKDSTVSVPGVSHSLLHSNLGCYGSIGVEISKSKRWGNLKISHRLAKCFCISRRTPQAFGQKVRHSQLLKDKPEHNSMFAGEFNDSLFLSVHGEALPGIIPGVGDEIPYTVAYAIDVPLNEAVSTLYRVFPGSFHSHSRVEWASLLG